MAIIKAQGLKDVAGPDFDPDNHDQYEKQFFQEKQSFVFSVVVTSLQTDKGREMIKEFEGMQGSSFPNSIIIILSPMLPNMRL